jgi:hypothetical protein
MRRDLESKVLAGAVACLFIALAAQHVAHETDLPPLNDLKKLKPKGKTK